MKATGMSGGIYLCIKLQVLPFGPYDSFKCLTLIAFGIVDGISFNESLTNSFL